MGEVGRFVKGVSGMNTAWLLHWSWHRSGSLAYGSKQESGVHETGGCKGMSQPLQWTMVCPLALDDMFQMGYRGL